MSSHLPASPHRASHRHGRVHDGHGDGHYGGHSAWHAGSDLHDERPLPDARPRHRAYAPTPARSPVGRDYTFGHAGRQIRIGPVAFWICVGTLVIMATWSIVTATYFAFHDDVLARLIARQAAMQFAYEDRIAEMRAQVDRVTSRHLLDQEQFERRLDQIAKRQAALETRTSSLGALADPSITGSIKPNVRAGVVAPPKPSPMSDKTTLPPEPTEREARLDWFTSIPFAEFQVTRDMRGGVEGELARLQESLDRVEARQTTSLNAIEASYDRKLKRMRGALAELGLPHLAPAGGGATGGPFVPYRLPSDANAFERQTYRVALTRAQADRLTRTMAALPIRKPVTGELDESSPFGVRVDPFLNRPAMHTGIDFRGAIGEPVRTTASGTVTAAGWSGGYGRMVEIDHGNGLATRYGHLSAIEAAVGQSVKIGQVVGRLGSTGRSTGPHLHYETRIDGEPVDPEKFLRVGIRMGSIQ